MAAPRRAHGAECKTAIALLTDWRSLARPFSPLDVSVVRAARRRGTGASDGGPALLLGPQMWHSRPRSRDSSRISVAPAGEAGVRCHGVLRAPRAALPELGDFAAFPALPPLRARRCTSSPARTRLAETVAFFICAMLSGLA